ncbi:lactonase family protein [Luteolibacter sp. AS25]|uniref:lactonase family protein n=1 Tax=Luteolibacter sp. AS25 TaxID=3135776 RepID=UPI00398BB93D
MKIPTALLLLGTHLLAAQPLYIGTNAEGIYLAEFDSETGTLTTPRLAAEFPRPGFLTLHPEKSILYAASAGNSLAAYSITAEDTLHLLGKIGSKGNNPCHLALDATSRTIALANYGNRILTTVRLDPAGKPLAHASVIEIPGSSIHPQRQKSSHVHGVYFDEANRYLLAPDLGTDKVLIYRFHPETSTITPNEPAHFSSPPGSGPRHLTFSPDQKHIYINNELTSTISATTFHPETGALSEIQTISTLPADFHGESTTAEIGVHPNGHFLYCSNRGHDTIAVYRRDPETGKLTYLQHAPCGGSIPRHFTIHPSGKWLLCAHQKSGSISVLPLDPATGLLSPPGNTVTAPSPICLIFR